MNIKLELLSIPSRIILGTAYHGWILPMFLSIPSRIIQKWTKMEDLDALTLSIPSRIIKSRNWIMNKIKRKTFNSIKDYPLPSPLLQTELLEPFNSIKDYLPSPPTNQSAPRPAFNSIKDYQHEYTRINLEYSELSIPSRIIFS